MCERHATTPAERIIAKFGGVNVVAAVVGRARQNVERWKKSRAEGGTGGLVPAPHQVELLRHAVKVGIPFSVDDFFPDELMAVLRLRQALPTAPTAAKAAASWGWVAGMADRQSVESISVSALSHAADLVESERKP